MFEIKKMRERAGLTQQEVADKLGIRKGRYGDWERETREINLRDASRLADIFGCTLEELAGRESPPEPESDLTAQESRVLDAYRDADVIERRIIERAAGIDSGEPWLKVIKGSGSHEQKTPAHGYGCGRALMVQRS